MDRDLKDLVKWFVVVALAIICFHLMACAKTIYEAPIITGQLQPPKLGTTACSENGLPVIVIEEKLPPIPIREVVIYHEQIHVKQMVRMGGCREFFKKFSMEKKFRVASELEAYCGSVNRAEDLGFERKVMLSEIERVMKVYYDTTLACGGRNETASQWATRSHLLPQHDVPRKATVPSVYHPP